MKNYPGFQRFIAASIAVFFFSSVESGQAEAPPENAVDLILGDLKEWKVQSSETGVIEIASGYGLALLKGGEGEPLAALGERKDGGRVVVFADRAFLDFEQLGEKEQSAVINCIRWAGKKSQPKAGLGQSLHDSLGLIEAAGVQALPLKTSELVDQVDLYCLAVRPNGGVFGEGQEALDRFVQAGGGLVLAGTGPEEQMTYFNTLISPAGIRFTSPAQPKVGELVAVAAIESSKTTSTGKAEKPAEVMTPIGGREEVSIPEDADGPVGAAVQLKELGSRKDAKLIGELKEGKDLTGNDRIVFREALNQLNLAVGPIIPTKEAPLVPGEDALVDAIVELETEFNRTLPAEEIRAIPASEDFPGSVPEDAPRVAKTVVIDSTWQGWLNGRNYGGPGAPEQRPTGLYAAPGEIVRVTAPTSIVDKGFTVIIGAYKGKLNNRPQWHRYPDTWRSFPIESKETLVANGFGGIITIGVPKERKGEDAEPVEVLFEGAVEAPLYVLGETSLDAWVSGIRKRPAPWAELASDRMILTLPSDTIRGLNDPDKVMELWNEIVDTCAELAMIDRTNLRAERIAFDRQTSAGALHSGYAIGAHIGEHSEKAVDAARLRAEGNWGFLHELGHNHQYVAWFLPNTTETTCNLWSVYVSEKLFGISRDDAHRACAPLTRRQRLNSYFNDGAKFATEWSVWTALESYLQIQEAFGWEPIQKVFTEYNEYEPGQGPKDQQQKNDEWVVRLSRACGHNLTPFYETWGLPLSDSVGKELKDLPAWEEDPVARYRKEDS